MKKSTAKPCFFARYSKPSPAAVEPEKLAISPAPVKPIGPRPASERLYFHGLPSGLSYMARIVLNEMDRISAPVIRAELVRRLCIERKTLNNALGELQKRHLVEPTFGKGPIRYALLDPPADCVFARSAREADAMECLSGQELVDELARKPKPIVDELPKWRLENQRRANTDRAIQAVVVDAIRRAEAISGIAELRPFLPADHPQLPDHLARKAIKQLLVDRTIVEQSIKLTPRRSALVYTLAASNGSKTPSNATRSTQASGMSDRA